MELWIPVTLAAAFFQTLRFMLQKSLSVKTLSTAGATFARFFYSAPMVALLLALWLLSTGQSLPHYSLKFWAYALTGGLTQILATVCVVALFRSRNFAVGITFKKTEVVQTALVGLVLLGEGVSLPGLAAILIGLIGVLLLSEMPDIQGNLLRRMMNRAAGLGLLSGLLFAFSGVCYRGASLQIASDEALMRAGATLAAVTLSQMIAMAVWLRLREPGQISAVWAARSKASWIGLMSMAGSFCWFTAFTLQNAAYVNALGQVELIFSLMASVLFFRESITRKEFAGIGFLTLSILVLILVI